MPENLQAEADRPPFAERAQHYLIILVLFMCLLSAVLYRLIFYTVHSGEGGVLYKRFSGGTVTEQVYGEGYRLVWPWDLLYIYDLRIKERHMVVEVLTTEGLTMKVEISTRYRPIRAELPLLHQQIGPDYERKIVIPVVGMAVQQVLGKFRPQEVYTMRRDEIQAAVEREAALEVADKHIELDRVIIRTITLPTLINHAIEEKLRQEQQSEEYAFRLSKEKQEADRKRIESEGIMVYQQNINRTLTSGLIQWELIRTKRELAASRNSKMVILDFNMDGANSPQIQIQPHFSEPNPDGDENGAAATDAKTAAPAAATQKTPAAAPEAKAAAPAAAH